MNYPKQALHWINQAVACISASSTYLGFRRLLVLELFTGGSSRAAVLRTASVKRADGFGCAAAESRLALTEKVRGQMRPGQMEVVDG